MTVSVCLNALAVPSFRQGGAGFYTATLLEGAVRDPRVHITALLSPELEAERARMAPDTRSRCLAASRRSSGRRAVNYLQAGWRPWTLDLGFESTDGGAEVVHWPISFMHAPSAPGARRVLTVLDMQHEFLPQFFSRKDLALRRLRWQPSARAADHIIAISEFTKRTLVERYGISSDRITAIPLACRREMLDETGVAGVDLPAPLDDGRPFVVYPASPLGAKNHGRLLDALVRHGGELRLVLTGPRMHAWDAVKVGIAQRGLEERVVLLHHVDDELLRTLYRATTGLIFPSLFEGFGLPVLEAMGLGCPVASSSAGSLPEVVGDGGRLFDPESVDAIAQALVYLERLAGEEREETVAAGRQQAGRFTPERMIGDTVNVYLEVTS